MCTNHTLHLQHVSYKNVSNVNVSFIDASTHIGTVAGRVDPQGFAEITPLLISDHYDTKKIDLEKNRKKWRFNSRPNYYK